MLKLTANNLRIIVKSLVSRIADADTDPRFTEVRTDGFMTFHLNSDDIAVKMRSLRDELDRLESALDNGEMLFGGSNITTKAAELDAELNVFVGKAKALGELATMLSEKPELE